MSDPDAKSGQEEEATTKPAQDRQLDVVLRFCLFMAMEEFDDGQASSTLLVYFSAVCGLSGDNGAEFARPATYTTHLSGLIYCTRLIILEGILPRVAHEYIGLPARPRRGQLELLCKGDYFSHMSPTLQGGCLFLQWLAFCCFIVKDYKETSFLT